MSENVNTSEIAQSFRDMQARLQEQEGSGSGSESVSSVSSHGLCVPGKRWRSEPGNPLQVTYDNAGRQVKVYCPTCGVSQSYDHE